MSRVVPLCAVAIAALAIAFPSLAKVPLPPPAIRPVDFAKDIQPLFEKHCIKCHGPEKEKSGWRADLKQVALKGGDNYAPNIIPGRSADSPLIHFVAGLEEEMLMPQKADPLSPEEIGLLRAWIDQGAVWPDEGPKTASAQDSHWAFQPLTRPPVPPDSQRNPVDAFVFAKLAEKNLVPSPEVDRRTLLRRLSFDLTGLPPTPEELEAFAADPNPQAYERQVERLLTSPRYGERWGRHWLDVVRFAESNGFETNRPRPNAWPYRDYVIRAFNEDKPYDQFIREQLAGDALGADEATGFLVAGAYDAVKSPDPVLTAQQRADELHDMVSTAGSTFLGLTVGCARCHPHKFDPISHVDYYAMTAVFQGVMHGERPMRPRDAADRLKEAAVRRAELAPVEAELAQFQPKAKAARVLVIDDNSPPPNDPGRASVTAIKQPSNNAPITYSPGKERGQLDDPGDVARLPNLGADYRYWTTEPGKQEDLFSWNPKLSGRARVWLSWGAWTTHTRDARYVLDLDGDLGTASDQTELAKVNQRTFADGTSAVPQQKRWSGLLDAGIHEVKQESRIVLRSGDTGGPTVADAVLMEEVRDGSAATAKATTPHVRPPVSHRANEENFEPVEANFVRFTITAASSLQPCIDELEVFTDEPTPRNVALASAGAKPSASSVLSRGANRKHQLAHLNDGRYGNDASWISSETGGGWAQVEFSKPERIRRVVWSRDRGEGKPAFEDRLPTSYRIEVSTDGEKWHPVASSADRLGVEFRKRITAIPTLSEVPADQLPEVERLTALRAKLTREIRELTTFPPVYAGKFEHPGPTHRLHRGDPMQKKETVVPGGLSEFSGNLGLTADTPEQQRRVALADWIASPKNPLTARVMVNRIWHYHFGTGLVDTPSDFGLNGGKPSHPELLDWLASEFIERGWRLKEMHRLIVTSATYKQRASAGAGESDSGMARASSHSRAAAIDAQNRLLWRFPPRRLEAEALRDTMLAVGGKLDLRVGGPGFDLFEPNDNYVKVYVTKEEYGPEEFRRMVYQSKPRVQLDDIFGAFDCPDAGQIAPRRTSSTTPLQALNLLNSPFALQQARFTAERLEKEAGREPAEQVRRAFELAFGRKPDSEETLAAVNLIREHGLVVFCRALFNTNEFITVF